MRGLGRGLYLAFTNVPTQEIEECAPLRARSFAPKHHVETVDLTSIDV
jgi:hypothetical protein